MKDKIKVKRIIFAILIIINCSVIFYFSNQVADNSDVQSSRLVEFVSKIIPAIRDMNEPDKTILKEEILTPIIRKTAHYSIYTILGIFTYNFIATYETTTRKKIIYALLFCTCYAATDEFHQLFVQGRSGELRDILIDSIGALTGILIVMGIKRIEREKKKNE